MCALPISICYRGPRRGCALEARGLGHLFVLKCLAGVYRNGAAKRSPAILEIPLFRVFTTALPPRGSAKKAMARGRSTGTRRACTIWLTRAPKVMRRPIPACAPPCNQPGRPAMDESRMAAMIGGRLQSGGHAFPNSHTFIMICTARKSGIGGGAATESDWVGARRACGRKSGLPSLPVMTRGSQQSGSGDRLADSEGRT